MFSVQRDALLELSTTYITDALNDCSGSNARQHFMHALRSLQTQADLLLLISQVRTGNCERIRRRYDPEYLR